MSLKDAADSRHWDTIAVHHMLIGMSDNPGQFRASPMSALFRQVRDERVGHSDGMDYAHVPF